MANRISGVSVSGAAAANGVAGASASATAGRTGAPGSGKAEATLGKNDFLKLLLAQLSNQDPLQPMDDKQFIAQLAQFNTLEQMQQVNQHLVDLTAAQGLAQASALLGRQVDATSGEQTISGTVTEGGLVDDHPMLTVNDVQVPLSAVVRIYTADDASTVPAAPTHPRRN